MKLKVIACGVFEPELTALVLETTNEVHLHFLDAGLHSTPDLLRERVQETIDKSQGQGYDALVIAYGLCGRGTSGILARDTQVILPRVHDCMTLFLGSREEYRKQFSEHPGTFYTTPGWYEKKSEGKVTQGRNDVFDEIRQDARFPELALKYGSANAADIIHFYDSWKRNYTRAAFIDTGYGDRERYAEYAEDMAKAFGWLYECLHGQVKFLQQMLSGVWDESRMLVLKPGQRTILTGDDRIFDVVDAGIPYETNASTDSCTAPPGSDMPYYAEECCGKQQQENAKPQAIPNPVEKPTTPAVQTSPEVPLRPQASADVVGIGIDAGGTYTDCVVYDLRNREVLAKAKALTTHHDLMIGIEEALESLGLTQPEQVRLVALSTTLATNSIVEAKGGLPGAIVMSAAPQSNALIKWEPLKVVRGEMAIDGNEISPPDLREIGAAVKDLLQQGVDAFAVSGYASVKNPEHELIVKRVIHQLCDLPVICGHELSTKLDYVSRANTAILNARLLPVIRALLNAVQTSLEKRGVTAPLMVVKGDGSLVNRETALERPVETVLSGPAASVSGARHLTGLSDCIVMDMGGTTTDTAVVEGGMVRISPHGATVGGWRTSVEAADMSTTGLGGDSLLSFTSDRRLRVGPRRVIPLAWLAMKYPEAKRRLMALSPQTILDRATPAALDFFVLSRVGYSDTINDRERELLAVLADGPLTRDMLAAKTGAASPRLIRTEQLEELGLIMRSALTPTDILHVTGEFCAWDIEAATHALGIFATLYGLSPEAMIERVQQRVVERIAGEVVAKEVPGSCGNDPDEWPKLLHTLFRPHHKDRLRLHFEYDRPIVAIGAPVGPFFPHVGAFLGARVIIPPHAEVANAIGAIAAEVWVREQATVRPGEISAFVVHARNGRTEWERLDAAIAGAQRIVAQLARERAKQAGTEETDVRYKVDERRAYTAEGDEMLIEVIVEATVSGRPKVD